MIFVAGTLTLDPSMITQFEADVAAMRPKVLEEDGCRHYSLLAEDRAGGVINVLEMWDDLESLKVHLKQPWIVEFFNKYVNHIKGMDSQVYDIAGSQPIPM